MIRLNLGMARKFFQGTVEIKEVEKLIKHNKEVDINNLFENHIKIRKHHRMNIEDLQKAKNLFFKNH